MSDVVHFIDYEYAFYNYEAFDIGNHFAEYAGKISLKWFWIKHEFKFSGCESFGIDFYSFIFYILNNKGEDIKTYTYRHSILSSIQIT